MDSSEKNSYLVVLCTFGHVSNETTMVMLQRKFLDLVQLKACNKQHGMTSRPHVFLLTTVIYALPIELVLRTSRRMTGDIIWNRTRGAAGQYRP